MDDDADAKMILTAPPPDNWKRPPGWIVTKSRYHGGKCAVTCGIARDKLSGTSINSPAVPDRHPWRSRRRSLPWRRRRRLSRSADRHTMHRGPCRERKGQCVVVADYRRGSPSLSARDVVMTNYIITGVAPLKSAFDDRCLIEVVSRHGGFTLSCVCVS